jgi:hypothetical protein
VDREHTGGIEDDPLLALAGSLESAVPDLAERHDYYLGQALLREMQRGLTEALATDHNFEQAGSVQLLKP